MDQIRKDGLSECMETCVPLTDLCVRWDPLFPIRNMEEKPLSGLGIKHVIVFKLTDILSKIAGLVSFFVWAARKLKLWLELASV